MEICIFPQSSNNLGKTGKSIWLRKPQEQIPLERRVIPNQSPDQQSQAAFLWIF